MSAEHRSLQDPLKLIIGNLRSCLGREDISLSDWTHGATLASMDMLYEEVCDKVEEIPAAQNIVKHVAYRRNTLTRINSLPNEILSGIFMETSGGHPLRSMPLSHTCSHWRDVSINCGVLWSRLHFADISFTPVPSFIDRRVSLDLIAIFLNRTQRYPFAFLFHDYNIPAGLLTLIGNHISHIRSLQLTTSHRPSIMDNQHWLFHGSAPMLEHLTIWGGNLDFVLPGLFDGGTPVLTRLALRDCQILSWMHPCFKGLTDLRIENITLPDQDYGDNGDFLQVLRTCPLLESLTVSSGNLGLLSTMRSTTDIILLPQLHKLTLNTRPALGAYILTHIAAPETSLQLSCQFRWPEGSDTALDMPFLPHHQYHFAMLASGFPELMIDLREDLRILLSLVAGRLMPPQSLAGAFVQITFQNWMSLPVGDHIFQNIMSWMTSSESMMSLLHLEIQSHNTAADRLTIVDPLLAILRYAPNVIKLTFDDLCPEFWSALEKECRNPHFLPALITIEFTGNVESIEEVIATWQSKRRAGSHLQEVRVHRKYMNTKWLTDIVDKVEYIE